MGRRVQCSEQPERARAAFMLILMIPIMISVLQQVQAPGMNIIGMTMILQFVVSFGFILPVNAPQNMVAYGTDTFVVNVGTVQVFIDRFTQRVPLSNQLLVNA